MEQQDSSYDYVCDQSLPLSANYPWFVADNLGVEEDDSKDHIFYTLHDPLSIYECQIPELRGRHIRGYYHGWVILSDHPQNWFLWNPVTSKTINFPPLILKDGNSESVGECCLSAPPDDPNSVLLLTRTNKPAFVFFRLISKRKKLIRWIEMSYASQLKRITGEDGSSIYNLTCCNGKLYAFTRSGSFSDFVIQLDIVVRDKEVLIKLSLLGACPYPSFTRGYGTVFLKGSCTELFYVRVCFYDGTLERVHLFKLDMTTLMSEEIERFRNLDMSHTTWEEVEDLTDLDMSLEMWEQLADLKDAVFFVDLACDHSVHYRPAVASEFGGYIHIRDRMGKLMYSYRFRENTISLSSMPSQVLPTSGVSIWEYRLEDDHGKAMCTADSKQKNDEIVVRSFMDYKAEINESHLLNLPFDILEMIMGLCVGVEYMNFRATCEHCYLAAPSMKWRDEALLRRMHPCSLISPWLLVVDENQGIITFTDPILGDSDFMKNLHVSLTCEKIYCSKFGWLLFRSMHFHCLVFFNPFTGDLRKLPGKDEYFSSACFSAPPASSDCIVVGFTLQDVYVHFVAREQSWRTLRVGSYSIRFPTFIGHDLYALSNEGELFGLEDLGKEGHPGTLIEAKAPRSFCTSPVKYYLMTCDQHLLLVIVGKFGEGIEVFKRVDFKQEWEKIDSLGKHMIYICGTTCLCIEATMPRMENKIYFPLLHSKSRKIVLYSLETCMYHTFNNENIQHQFKDFLGTTYHLFPHAWIEPSWC